MLTQDKMTITFDVKALKGAVEDFTNACQTYHQVMTTELTGVHDALDWSIDAPLVYTGQFTVGKPVEPTEPVLATDVADLLDAAADELEKNGHIKRSLGRNEGPKCTMGALYFAAIGDTLLEGSDDHKAMTYMRCRDAIARIDAAARAITNEISDGDPSKARTVLSWNDHPLTTPTEVIDTLRFAAKRLRSGESL